MQLYIWTTVAYFVAACLGIYLNSVLVVVFTRRPKARSLENLALLNVCIADIACLVTPFISRVTVSGTISANLIMFCSILVFFRSFVVALNTYSVAAVSIQRYVGLFRFKNHLPHDKRSYQYSRLIGYSVWLVAAILATAVSIVEGASFCSASEARVIPGETTFRLVIFGVIPSIIMAVFCIMSACKIRMRSSELAREESDVAFEATEDRRNIITTGFLALAIFFAVTELPLIITSWVLRNFVSRTDWWVAFHQFIQLAYVLNPVFNPVVLCVASSEIRKLFRRYCCSCCYCCKETNVSSRPEAYNTNMDTTDETELSRL